jgi:hypothetical protein
LKSCCSHFNRDIIVQTTLSTHLPPVADSLWGEGKERREKGRGPRKREARKQCKKKRRKSQTSSSLRTSKPPKSFPFEYTYKGEVRRFKGLGKLGEVGGCWGMLGDVGGMLGC